ncbi:hypothetical protein NQ317_016774 [Molorchus minor]|uniref:Uncharacterized protein n=1 Tax=Molorchus minor TaxID=1323400 RepID=A0ABQ9J1W7_9CUCU|nr:hypothetical protein NQ317_016774 [Molorchus minor]
MPECSMNFYMSSKLFVCVQPCTPAFDTNRMSTSSKKTITPDRPKYYHHQHLPKSQPNCLLTILGKENIERI